jgi:hypothetical protein
MNLLLSQKDEVINQLQLELAKANDELVEMQWRLSETEKMLVEAWKQIPKPPNASDLYKTEVELVNKAHNTLLEKVYSRSNESQGITTDTFAQASVRHLDTVKALAEMESGLVPAFDLVMLLAKTCWNDPDARKSMSGDGDSEEPFLELHTQLLSLIDERLITDTGNQEAVDPTDWPAAALEYLKCTSDYLANFGLDGYFEESIAKLEEIV